ncbi:sugar ABC transporter substrate-binding protein [Gracilibacillus massiliensis]|uniref:sugar ABC transporter substrate-binding protein n=1 Tax=Gracilibacillus massiliensis TaxID=1564956 RepID=UPI00071C8220|nr:sugar ABC transporter substrate-binding protein [Gracilibacillus massiliensis]
MRKYLIGFVLLALMAITVACGSDANDEANTDNANGNSESEDGYNFVFLPNTQNNTFQIAMHETYQQLAEEHGYGYTMLDPDYDLNTQLNQMADAANQGYDAAFVIPVDSAGIRQGLENFQNNDVPVFNVDTAVIEEDREFVESVIATDAFMAGKLMGEQVVEDYPDGAKIAILDFPENESCVQRVNGFMEGLASGDADYEIVAQQNGKAALDESLPIAQDILQSNPDLNAFFAINDPSALGVVAALDANGKQEDVDVYSVDASPDGKEALLDGSFTSVAAQVPIEIAKESFQMAIDHLEGNEIEEEVYLPSHIVTEEIAEETSGEWQ